MIPFLKWPGGKRWLLDAVPSMTRISYNRFFEPFLGGGAVFFALEPKFAHIADANSDLINTYKAIRDKPDEISRLLKTYQKKHSKDFYYKERAKRYDSPTREAARFVYLNRTCFNGIYRVNLNGQFNVPIGTKSTVCMPTDDFRSMAKLLRRVRIRCDDFARTIEQAQKGDLIFADPPYTVRHHNNGFVKYNESLFSWSDQERLCEKLLKSSRRGVKVILSNADHASIRDLYKESFQIIPISRSSVISAAAESRGQYKELLICNFDFPQICSEGEVARTSGLRSKSAGMY